MAVNERRMTVHRDDVWAVLEDGRTYSYWVVGTSAIRDVDTRFPAVGTSLHYRVGWGPVRHDGNTEVLEVDTGRRLVLEAHAWPAGSARIAISLTEGDGGCVVQIDERPIRGVAGLLHNPGWDAFIKLRNVESLRRLERLAARRAGRGGAGGTPAGD
jgi:hypothetical protein